MSFVNLRAQENNTSQINWITWEEAVKIQDSATSPKKMYIDMYTDWCVWCKRMDKSTFSDPAVIKYMNEHFYMVKFNAESKKIIVYKGKDYHFVPYGRNGFHQLAYNLLNGQLGYPSGVILDEHQKRIDVVQGYLPAQDFLENIKSYVTN
ncbi:thioredoxin family protein [Zhouia sp. PK063]|uniref:thioredoxin family protein n=1 Tax=Zhouia sp. PK063 TaxID=3373602 RepID=UPI0037900BAA